MEQRTEEGRQAKREYIKDYNKETYDFLKLRLLKGEKDKIKKTAQKRGQSINQYFVDCINFFEYHHQNR
jgi:hypothetical protein